MSLEQNLDELTTKIADEINLLQPIIIPFGGQFLLDPNEVNGWGVIGMHDNTNSQDLGNVGAANLSRIAGGFVAPFDIKVTRLMAWHQNNNGAAQAWGWVMAKQAKTAGSNDRVTTYILDEVADNAGTGPRNYLNTTNQKTDIAIPDAEVAEGETLILGVAAPTAVTTNRYVRVMSGSIVIRRA